MKFKIFIVLFQIFTTSIIAAQSITSSYSHRTYIDTSYQDTYNTLKQLFVKKINSPSYLKSRMLLKAYAKKWRVAHDAPTEELFKDPGLLNWLRDNWRKTEFTSYEEAEKEFSAVNAAVLEDTRAHPEFEAYSTNAILKFGPLIYTRLVEELMLEYPDKF